jgi:acetyltransferase-like isoleucine patch superfamily enzyme
MFMPYLKVLPLLFLVFISDFVKYITRSFTRAKYRARGVFIGPGVNIVLDSKGAINLARGVSIGRSTHLIATNEMAQIPGCEISIAENSTINENCNLRGSGGKIIIGRNCIVAQFVSIIASNHDISAAENMKDEKWSIEKTKVEIGDNVWIGANSVLLPGISIGDGAVIAAGSVVTRSVQKNSVVAGVPAKFVKLRFPES